MTTREAKIFLTFLAAAVACKSSHSSDSNPSTLKTLEVLQICDIANRIEANSQLPKSDWSHRVSFDQFKELLKDKVKNIVPLNSLWDKKLEGEKITDLVYFSGGRLRGLLNWLDEQLTRHSYEQVLAISPPSIAGLNPLKNPTDKDLTYFHPEARSFLKDDHGFKEWDLLDSKWYLKTVDIAGPTIDKLLVNSEQIIDPFHSLYDFYRGRFSYQDVPEETFSLFRDKEKSGLFFQESKANLVMRAIRISLDIPRMAMTSFAWEEIRRIVKLESKYIPKHDNGGERLTKSLKKLSFAYQGNPTEIIDALYKSGLLHSLAKNGYKIQGLSLIELVEAYYDEIIPSTMKARFKKPKDSTEMVKMIRDLAVEDRCFFSEWSKENFDYLQKLILNSQSYTNPENFFYQFADVTAPFGGITEITTFLLLKTTSAAQYLRMVSSVLKNSDQGFHYGSVRTATANSAMHFFRLKPSIFEVKEFNKYVARYWYSVDLAHNNIFSKARTIEEFMIGLRAFEDKPSSDYKRKLDGYFQANIEKFKSLKPSFSDIRKVSSLLFSIDAHIEFVVSVKDEVALEDWPELFIPCVAKPNSTYLYRLDQAYNELYPEYLTKITEKLSSCQLD